MLNSTPSPHPIPTSTRTPTQVRISKPDCQAVQALKLRLREGDGEWRTAYEGPPPGAESWHGAGLRRSFVGRRVGWALVRHGCLLRARYRRH